jgi:hypothetical protein
MLDGRVDAFARNSISGWAADMDQPGVRVDVTVSVNGKDRGRLSADQPRQDLQVLGTMGDGAHGFAYVFDPPLLPGRSYEIIVCHAGSKERLRLGQFTIAAEAERAIEGIRPIIVNTFSEPSLSDQPGLIALMHGLASDPAVVAADSHAYGVKLMAYYAHALDVLVTPRAERAHRFDDARDRALASNPFDAPEYEHLFPQALLLHEIFQTRSKAKISAAFKDVVVEFYETLAVHEGKQKVAYFAEQCDLFDTARSFARLAFSDVREIVLLRDPRDAYCGYRQLWFSSAAQALETLRRVRERTVELRRENRGDTMFLRCEDLLLRPQSTWRQISRFLTLGEADIADPQRFPATDAQSVAAIAKWKTELNGSEVAMFEREFGDYLELFGYDVSASAPA